MLFEMERVDAKNAFDGFVLRQHWAHRVFDEDGKEQILDAISDGLWWSRRQVKGLSTEAVEEFHTFHS